jgi:hypothetical protein
MRVDAADEFGAGHDAREREACSLAARVGLPWSARNLA